MTAVCEVRRYLREKNFTIRGEVIAKEGKRLYNVMTAAKNHAAKQAEPPDDAIYDYIGKRLITAAKTARETVGEGYAPLGEYITRRVNALTVAIETMRGGADTAEKRAEFTALRARLLEVYHDCYGGGHSK
jgi:tRNA A22 N-methylase